MVSNATIGAPAAVHQWRATTLTLLSQRKSFTTKRAADVEAVVQEILQQLSTLLPPPSQYLALATESLRNIIQNAVQLAVEMRTQRAEYVVKRPPAPAYDDNGDVSNTVYFIASKMQNRGGDPVSDKDLEAERATVKTVLFPAVIRRGNEYGEDYATEAVVLPMQVLVNRQQLRSESRATGRPGREEHHNANVSRLTPITDHSPRTTPRTTPEKARITSPKPMPIIPESTIRLVPNENAPVRQEKKRRGSDR